MLTIWPNLSMKMHWKKVDTIKHNPSKQVQNQKMQHYLVQPMPYSSKVKQYWAWDTWLSTYIWSLKEKNIKYDITWSIAAKASPYACGTRKCDLCLTEKLLIAKSDPEKMLNHRAEIFAKCRHQNKFKVCKSWPLISPLQSNMIILWLTNTLFLVF